MKRTGFSFIELIIYMGIVSVLMLVMINMFGSTLDVQLKSQSSSALDLDSQYLLARLNYDIHRAATITTPGTLGQTTSSLALVINGVTYTYSIINQKLNLTIPAGTYTLNSADVLITNFSVTRVGQVTKTPTIQVNLTLQSSIVSSTQVAQTRSYVTTITPRLK